MRRALPLLPLLALAACAIGPSLDERLATYIGRSELELVSSLGVPTRSYETGGQKFLQYEENRTVAVPGGFIGGPWGPWGPYSRGFYGGFSTTAYAPVQCDVTFALREGRVASYVYRGQGCA
ncbi:hypothetical protein J8J14_01380 [Roseomonas sp. SSH11]|uniref:Lipoprotein n=1 Tax=Pararoseomonas baculiformis TaxID=2820812 RepID=A0ABS4A8U3_9PROT|nr:hypothetical protein [Pararoseomonas baculiformis]MBP0443417.1 hypothetical protein [Pararoseomonas baculiformis]